MNRLIEDIVICVTIALGLTISFYFLYATVVHGTEYPPSAIGAFFGLAIAALTYRFLGGTQTTEVSFGLLKLTGSAALLLGSTFVLGSWIAKERKLFADSANYREEIISLNKELAATNIDIAQKNKRILQLQRDLRNAPGARGQYTLDEIKQLEPGDSFVRDLRQMVLGKQGPFREVIREMQVTVAVVGIPGEVYNICQKKYDELYQGVSVPDTRLRIARSVGAQANEEFSIAQRRGFIGSDICNSSPRDFEIQISCPIAEKLFSDVITSCAEGQKVRGMTVTVGALAN